MALSSRLLLWASFLFTLYCVTKASPDYRTAFHFQPLTSRMKDPNGPMLFKGIYHLFYQYSPSGKAWTDVVWGHSTSKDLINWTPQKYALIPLKPYDINGCWSGSATILPGKKPMIFYTGVNSRNEQSQNLAQPRNLSDPYLKEWIKSPLNPIMTSNMINKINATEFRDPSTAWQGKDKKWRLIVGSKYGNSGVAILYEKGMDLGHWKKTAHPLHSVKKTGMWECPDFYPVLVNGARSGVDASDGEFGRTKHVLKMSHDDTKHDHYLIGRYESLKNGFVPDQGPVESDFGLRYDYGKFYASKSFFDIAKKRRVLWGWVDESIPEEVYKKRGWSGIQAIPRTLWLDKNGKHLMQWPVEEIKKIRSKQVNLDAVELVKGSVVEIQGVTSAQADVVIWFDIKSLKTAEELDPSWTNPQVLCDKNGVSVKGKLGPFGLLVLASKGLEEYTALFFRIYQIQNKHILLMCSDSSRSSLNKDTQKDAYGAFVDMDLTHQKISLRTLIDHSVVESFGEGGKSCITTRVYPTLAIDDGAHLFAFNNGTESVHISRLSAWSMKTAQIN